MWKLGYDHVRVKKEYDMILQLKNSIYYKVGEGK